MESESSSLKTARHCGSSPGALHAQLQAAINGALPSTTPIDGLLNEYGIPEKLALASPAEVHALQLSGTNLLVKLLPLVVAQRTAGDRPAGHCKAIQGALLSTETKAMVMGRADTLNATTHTRGAARSDAMHIFFAALCTYGGLAQGVAWFDALLGRAVSAADGVYLTFNLPLEFAELEVSQGGQETPSYSQALAILFPSTPNSLASTSEKVLRKTPERGDSSSLSPSSAQVAATMRPGTQTGTGIWSEVDSAALPPLDGGRSWAGSENTRGGLDGPDMEAVEEDAAPPRIKRVFGTVAGVIIDEGQAFFNEAFPDGVQALAAKGPVAFVSGLWSALASNAPRGQKRKADTEDDAAGGAGTSQRRKTDNEAAVHVSTVPSSSSTTTPATASALPSAPSATSPAGSFTTAASPAGASPSAAPPTAPAAPARRRPPPPAPSVTTTSPRSGICVAHAVHSFNALGAPPSLLPTLPRTHAHSTG